MARVGRPKGPPSRTFPVLIPEELIERLDRYLDRAETLTSLTSNRSDAIRQALSYWLDAREATLLNR